MVVQRERERAIGLTFLVHFHFTGALFVLIVRILGIPVHRSPRVRSYRAEWDPLTSPYIKWRCQRRSARCLIARPCLGASSGRDFATEGQSFLGMAIRKNVKRIQHMRFMSLQALRLTSISIKASPFPCLEDCPTFAAPTLTARHFRFRHFRFPTFAAPTFNKCEKMIKIGKQFWVPI